MNKIVLRYGTFLIIPPLVIGLVVMLINFKVSIRTEITLFQYDPDRIIVYMADEINISDTLSIDTPETGIMNLPVIATTREGSNKRITCSGNLDLPVSMLRIYVENGRIPLYRALLNRL